MSDYSLRLIEDKFGSDSKMSIPPINRAIYLVSGEVNIDSGLATNSILTPNSAWSESTRCTLSTGHNKAVLWRWEIINNEIEEDDSFTGDGVCSTLKSTHRLPKVQMGKTVIRCDRVDFPLGGIAYTHTHLGPGLRCLLKGQLIVKTEDAEWTVNPGDTWFETGPDPIYAEASNDYLTSFVRFLVLPPESLGKQSIRYVKAEDLEKPKTQTYTVFLDRMINL